MISIRLSFHTVREVMLLRKVPPEDASDESVLQFAHDNDCVLLTCNRDDFLQLARHKPHRGIVVVIRRRTRAAERAALFRLLDSAGESGLKDNINFLWNASESCFCAIGL
jgi:predicted nuclease of predicted toxin-antitoxin system